MTPSERRFATWTIAAIVLFFLVTRLGLFWRFPLFYDEAFYALRIVDGFESAEHRFDSLLGGTVQAMYFCPTDQKETEKHPLHTCGTETVHIRGWQWLDNDWVNFGCGLFAVIVAMGLYIL